MTLKPHKRPSPAVFEMSKQAGQVYQVVTVLDRPVRQIELQFIVTLIDVMRLPKGLSTTIPSVLPQAKAIIATLKKRVR
ncbi:hypothetical protein BaRGS_00036400 [Batillaria attramentaria]|uniref:Uncharacterized protein n=1 Tax=Batillaria attramentaria TaxID=370345 RepID=A0ABD0JC12_9CAEN